MVTQLNITIRRACPHFFLVPLIPNSP